MTRRRRPPTALLLGSALAFGATLPALPAAAQSGGPIDCELRFELSGWSAF